MKEKEYQYSQRRSPAQTRIAKFSDKMIHIYRRTQPRQHNEGIEINTKKGKRNDEITANYILLIKITSSWAIHKQYVAMQIVLSKPSPIHEVSKQKGTVAKAY
jgi:hypothetical protein